MGFTGSPWIRTLQILSLTEGYGRNPRVTPDGKSIVYLGMGEDGSPPARVPQPVMRVSVTGGPSQRLFTARAVQHNNLCEISFRVYA